MICKNCGEQLPDNAKFCGSCGSKLETENISKPIVDTEETNDIGQTVEADQNVSGVTGGNNGIPISQIVQDDSDNNTASSDSGNNSKKAGGNPLSSMPKPLIAFLAICLVAVIVIVPIIAISSGEKKQPDYYDENNYPVENDGINNEDLPIRSEAVVFYVYFEPNNGDSVKEVKSLPGYIEEPEEPVREGYIFDGWYTEEELEYEWDFDFDEAFSTLYLYAKWVEDETEYNENEKIVIAGDGLRLRATPDISGKKIALIPNGTRIIITDTTDGWSCTTYKGKTGWCSSDFLFDPADYEGEVLFKACVENRNGITMYVDQDTDSTIINNYIPYKSTVYVYEVDDLWSYVRYGDQYGWCLSEYLDDF